MPSSISVTTNTTPSIIYAYTISSTSTRIIRVSFLKRYGQASEIKLLRHRKTAARSPTDHAYHWLIPVAFSPVESSVQSSALQPVSADNRWHSRQRPSKHTDHTPSQTQYAAYIHHLKRPAPPSILGGNTLFYSIFHQRLQKHDRHHYIEGLCVYLTLDP